MQCLEYVYVSGAGASWNSTGTVKSGIASVSIKFNKATPIYDKPVDVIGNTPIAIVTTRAEMNDTKNPVFKNPNYKAK
jgi:hypothetical protein